MITTPHLLAVDPGGTTGLALFSYWNEGSGEITLKETGYRETCEFVRDTLDAFTGSVTVCIEKFTISERTMKLGRDHNAIELTGAIRWLLLERNLPEPLFASPADAKRLITDARLKALGVWHKGGGGHANDAARHGLLWLAKSGLRLPA